jgi:hypothetical protein
MQRHQKNSERDKKSRGVCAVEIFPCLVRAAAAANGTWPRASSACASASGAQLIYKVLKVKSAGNRTRSSILVFFLAAPPRLMLIN